jgi:hypothetical protein
MDVSVYNQAGQLVGDQKQHKIPTLSYADLSSSKDFMRMQGGFLLIAKYFVKESYLK